MVNASSRGASTIEYALMVAAIAGGAAAISISGLGEAVSSAFQQMVDGLNSGMSSSSTDGGSGATNGGNPTGTSSPTSTPSPSALPTPAPAP